VNIASRLVEQAAVEGSRAALVDVAHGHPRVTTFGQLDDASARGAAYLASLGARPGDAVVLLHRMSLELYVALIAVFRLGLVAVVPDPSASRAQTAAALAALPLSGFIASRTAHLLRLIHPAFRRVSWAISLDGWLPRAFPWQGIDAIAPRRAIADLAPGAPALVTFTSGSTSLPKVAVRSHAFLLAQHDVLARTLALTAGEVDLSTLPVFVLANLASGVTSVLPDADLRAPGQIDPGPVMAQAIRHHATRTAASPGLLGRLVDESARTHVALPFTTVHVGGAPVFPPFLDRLAQRAPHARVVSVYGSTEAEPIAEIDRKDIGDADRARMRLGGGLLAGSPVPEIALRILGGPWQPRPIPPLSAAEFDARIAADGAPGEIVVSGAHVLSGYLGGRGDEETKFRVDGRVWHRTGDAGYLDATGRLWLLGRCQARVEDGHGAVYPFSVECGATHCPGVRRAAFVQHAGRRVLLVQPEPATQSVDLDAVATELAWAHLAEIREYPSIPVDRRHNAKIDYTALGRLLETTPTRRLTLAPG
jgi:acyl-CoA synthetase (AMP-forming)/AMP-acid ligase II